MDWLRELGLPPRDAELDSNFDRWTVLELAYGAPLSVVLVNIDSSEIHDAESRQWNGTDDGRIWLVGLDALDRNIHLLILGIAGNSSDRAVELSLLLRLF